MIMLAAAVVPATPATAEATKQCNIVTGGESTSQQVARLYKAVFDRPPEAEGWNYWRGTAATVSIFDIAAHFVRAPEFINLYGDATNAEFVDLVYLNVMGREPDVEGYEYWLGLLDRKELSRAAMVVYFSESAEFKRREDGQYFEQCDRLFEGMPSVLISSSVGIVHEPTRSETSRQHFTSTYDATSNSSSYAKVQTSGPGDSWFGHRPGGGTCLTWKSAPRKTVGDTVTSNDLGHGLAFTTGSHEYLEDTALRRIRIAEFQMAVREADGFEFSGCDADAAELTRFSAPVYRMMPDIPADAAEVVEGYVQRRFQFYTAEVRAILNLGDTTLLDLVPSLATDLEAIEASDVPADSIALSVWMLEDPTGNLFAAKAHYRGYITLDGVPWSWGETTAVFRVPEG